VKVNKLPVHVLLVGTVIILLLQACSAKRQLPTDEERKEAQAKTPCIIVLPVETKVNSDSSVTFDNAAVLESGAEFMDSLLAEAVVGKNNVRVLSNRQLTSLIPSDAGTQMQLIRKVGSELKCSAVLMTTLVDYRQREGGSYGAETPASAHFSMRLINTRDGRVLWHSMFKETQQSLMSNLMTFGKAENRGFKWITVEELVRQGIHEKIEECPYL